MNILIVGIDTKQFYPPLHFRGHIFVQQLERTDARNEQGQALENLKDGNQPKTSRL
jgi:hypothetical protein